jgi:hypothetical protein
LSALGLLKRAREVAAELRLDPREFAVSLAQLVTTGLGLNCVRALLAGGLVDVAEEPGRGRSGRLSPGGDNHVLSRETRFVLTPLGEQRLKEWQDRPAPDKRAPTLLKPQWDAERRQLWYRQQLVKWYRQPADSQETILATFEEDGWPLRIDDPLPRQAGLCPRDRLHNAVKKLNQSQLTRLLLFRRDGSGEGVTWEGR